MLARGAAPLANPGHAIGTKLTRDAGGCNHLIAQNHHCASAPSGTLNLLRLLADLSAQNFADHLVAEHGKPRHRLHLRRTL